MDFNITSDKCWVLQYLEQARLSGSWAQGQGHCGYYKKTTTFVTLWSLLLLMDFNITAQMLGMTISRASPWLKVKVTMAIFRKTLSSL